MPDIVDLVMEMGQPTARVPAHVEKLVETARDYADNASSENIRDDYAKDWKHFTSWCRRNGFDPLPPDSKVIGLYIGACAAGGTKLGPPGPLRFDDRAQSFRYFLEFYAARSFDGSGRSAPSPHAR